MALPLGATATTAASGGNREELLGQRPAGCKRQRSRRWEPQPGLGAERLRGQGRRQRAFLRLFSQKILESPNYRTFPLLYSGQNEKTEEGTGMKDVELRYVGGHVEVYTEAGAFLFSADTLREAMEELDAA